MTYAVAARHDEPEGDELHPRPVLLASTVRALQLLGYDDLTKPLLAELVQLLTAPAPVPSPAPPAASTPRLSVVRGSGKG